MVDNPVDLSDRTILVTGASSGIGMETAVLLSSLGARLVLCGRDRGRLNNTAAKLDGQVFGIEEIDLAELARIPAWIARVAAECGPLHGLVHSAGIHSAHPLRVLTAEKVEEVLRVNVASALMLAKGLRQKNAHAPGAAMVLLSSAAGLVGEAGVSAYSASKAAVVGLTRSLAVELASQQIRVNCVAPGIVRTGMTERLERALTPEQFAALEAAHPLGLGSPRDVANGVAFLLSSMARWITGTTLVIDGGYTAH
jgi:NAD(P)-dependent dehydrogenase (short-subunit alcohol dehydrogenase family)